MAARSTMCRSLLLSFLVLAVTAPSSYADNGIVKSASILFEGPANAAGSFQIRLVQRPGDCATGPVITQQTVSYDGVAGGLIATTATEIRDAVVAGLIMPAGYTIRAIPGNSALQIVSTDKAASPEFDVCILGGAPPVWTKIIGDLNGVYGPFQGVKITGASKSKLPGAPPVVLALIAVLLLAVGGYSVGRTRMRLA